MSRVSGAVFSAVYALSAVVAGCTGSQPVAGSNGPAPDSADYPSGPVPSIDMANLTACDWILANDPETTPVPSGWIDLKAGYWTFKMSKNFPVGIRVRIDGQYPNTRFFSIAAEEGIGTVVDSRADYRIAPLTDGTSPFVGQSTYDPTIAPGAPYKAYLVLGPKPAQSAKNAIYIDPTTLPSSTQDILVIMRMYNPPPGQAIAKAGNVPLPKLTVETAQGDVPLSSFKPGTASCQATFNSQAAISTLGTEIISAGEAKPQAPGPIPPQPVPAAPAFVIYRPSNTKLSANLTINPDVQYGYWTLSQTAGDLVYLRALVPGYVTQPGVGAQPHSTEDNAQVRHWAVCTNGSKLVNSRTFACAEDYTASIDSDGYYNVLISIPGKKPAASLLAKGYDWLTYGQTTTDLPIYRQLVPSPDYGQAMANVSDDNVTNEGQIANVMGAYMPQATYCGSTVFATHVQNGESHAQVFAACQAGK
ncbi:MAG: hypothetical protein P4L83_19245 [Nevskia sp.]|nr:hypothetical protein [Nevskia sp.]